MFNSIKTNILTDYISLEVNYLYLGTDIYLIMLVKTALLTERKCRGCLITFPIEFFRKRVRKTGRIEFEYNCLECAREISRQYNKNCSKNDKSNRSKKYNAKDKTKQKRSEYYIANKKYFLKKQKERDNRKRREDPFYRLRHRVSCVIWQYLNKTGGSKYGHSCLKFLDYTIPELKSHLEAKFEPWMTWENYGPYKKSQWNDADPYTWKWQIDHIIPHSMLPYTSMEDSNFKKAWALNNLRPYSAKQNFLDGISRIRHL
jgi:hypothetical protein